MPPVGATDGVVTCELEAPGFDPPDVGAGDEALGGRKGAEAPGEREGAEAPGGSDGAETPGRRDVAGCWGKDVAGCWAWDCSSKTVV